MPDDNDAFIPGAYWTPARSQAALKALDARWNSDEIQALLLETPDRDFSEALPPELMSAGLSEAPDRELVRIRRGRAADIPRLAALIISGNLPPLFLDEFVEGFAVAGHAGEVVACGGVEMYGDCGVIRSVVVDEAARGLGLGRGIAELLCEDARLSGAAHLYLFTQDAWEFWKTLGFADVPLDQWHEAPRACWQYRYISLHPEMMTEMGIHPMRKPA